MQIAAAAAGALLLFVAYSEWDDAPPPQIGKATVEGKESVVTKKTTTTATDKSQTVVEEPAVAVAGRSEAVVLGFLAAGAILLVGAALPGRNFSLKAGGLEAKLDSAATAAVATTAAQGAEVKAQEQGADPTEVKAVGAVAAQEAVIRLPSNLDKAEPGSMKRVLGRISGLDVPDATEIVSMAAEQTIEEAQTAAVARVLGPISH